MAGETDLDKLLTNLNPELQDGEYVFCTIDDLSLINDEHIICFFREKEGLSIILRKQHADMYELDYSFIASWITLQVHSSLDAVGLTAAFSNALASSEISCNVIAGFYHDHIFVNQKDAQKALEVLNSLK